MNWLEPAIIATLFNTLILSLIYLYLYLNERASFLMVFFISWSIYSLRYVFMLLHIYSGHDILLVSNQILIVVSSHLLFSGFNLWLNRHPSPWYLNAATAVSLLWIVGAGFSDIYFTLYTLPGFLYVGVIYIRMGVVLLKARSGPGLGERIVAVTLVVWGIHKLDYPFLRPLAWFAPWGYLLGALAAIITGIGMILVYFESTREQLEASVREKEILLREVHHRVKNNLSVLHSLVKYQYSTVENPELEEILQRLENKIFAFVLIHTSLYRSDTLDRIDFREYLLQLCAHILQSFGEPEGSLDLRYGISQPGMEIDYVKNMGLIINELVTNSLKYAFPDSNGDKKIVVELSQIEGNRHQISVSDNGTGLSENALSPNPKMSGLYLVRLLCEDLNGSLTISSNGGTRVTMVLPAPQAVI